METLYTYPANTLELLHNPLKRYLYLDRPLLVEYLIREGNSLDWRQVELLWMTSNGRKVDIYDKEKSLTTDGYKQKPVIVVSCSYLFSEGLSPCEYMKKDKQDIEKLILERIDLNFEITYVNIDIFDKIKCLYWYHNRNVFSHQITFPGQLTNIKFAEWYGISYPVYISDVVEAFESPNYEHHWVVGETIKYGTVDSWITFDPTLIEVSISTSSSYKYIPSYEYDKLTLLPLIEDGIFNFRELSKLRTELVRVLSSGDQKYRKLALLLPYIHEVIPSKSMTVPTDHKDIVKDIFMIIRDLGRLDHINEIEIRKAMLDIDTLLVSMNRMHAYITLSVKLFDDPENITILDILKYIRSVNIKEKVVLIRRASNIISEKY